MESSKEVIQENYAKNLKPAEYVAMMTDCFKEDIKFKRLPQEFMHSVLQSGRFKGSRLLDLCSGAVVHNIALASAFFPNIIMCDYVQANCEELKRWLKGESSLKQFLDVPAELEGYGRNLETGQQLLENRIRKSVKQVVRCDVLTDNIFLEVVKPDVAPPYDLIIASLCLEDASPDFNDFVLVLKRVNKILRPGGGLILVGFFGGKTWKIGEIDFHYIEISEDDIRKALNESGFGNINMKIYEPLDLDYEHEKFYCLATEKI